jgi:FkbM family methyltransferase
MHELVFAKMSNLIVRNSITMVEGDHISKEMEERGIECDLMLRDILPHIHQGAWVVDVGAAMGDHTAAYVRTVGPTGKVFAFEPNPSYFHCLQVNVPTAIHFNRPLWYNRDDLFWLHSPIGNQGAGYLNRDPAVINSDEICSGPFRALLLDDFGLIRLDFIKLDCEGAEYFVLKGGEETIRRLRPKMVMEMNPGPMERMGLNHMVIYDLLTEWGYDWKSIRNENTRFCQSCDILCWPK